MMESTANYKDIAQLNVYETPTELAREFSDYLIKKIKRSNAENKPFYLALSGGSTPSLIFKYLAENRKSLPSLSHLHIFWGDERCVPPGNPESNYGNAYNSLLMFLNIPDRNIHRIHGELDAGFACKRYISDLSLLPKKNNFPLFDLIILGIGEDGHTASIFPDQMQLLKTQDWVGIAKHPSSSQKRITLSGPVLNNAREIAFLASGEGKKKIIDELFKDDGVASNYPSYHIRPGTGKLHWFIDKDAAG